MTKKKCGLDLDGVVYDYISRFDEFIKGKGFKIDYFRYDRGLDKNELVELVDEFKAIGSLKIIQEYEGVVKSINELSKIWDFYIITARTDTFNGYQDTKERIFKSGINHKNIFFSKHKGQYSKFLDLDFFIEDNYENALDIINFSKTKVFLLTKSYNLGEKHPRIIRINRLEELL